MSNTMTVLRSKLYKLLVELRHLPAALRLVWAAARRWTALWIVLLVVQGVLPVALVYLTRALVDGLVGAVGAGGGWEVARRPLALALVMAALLVLGEMLRAATRWVRTAQAELVSDHIRGLIHERSVAVDLGVYESPSYHDRLYLARWEARHRPVALVENLGGLLQSGLTLLAMAAVLVTYGWWLPVALAGSTLPALWVVLRYAVRHHDWRLRTTERERRSVYVEWLLTSREAAAEVRLFDLGEHFRQAFHGIRVRLRSERLDLARSEALAEMAAAAFALVVMGAALAWILLRTLRGEVTLGGLAMFYQAFHQGQRLLRSLLETVGQLYANSLFLGNLFEFLGIEPRIVEPVAPARAPVSLERGIAFRGVTFSYPSSVRPVLEGFDLELRAGEVTALLGANGAGKSTLFKLLCRFYDPEEGRVEIDGTDVRELPVAELRRLITVLFQEPVRYSETVRRNVQLGDVACDPSAARVEAAVRASGAGGLVEGLPDGLDTLLGTWFAGGAELSPGEWQRVALSRAFLREAAVVLLDEPTAAMDSWAEVDWLQRFRGLAEGKTAVVITHRLTTARAADVIHVMEAGRVVESGRHDELVRRGGRYAEAWKESVEC